MTFLTIKDKCVFISKFLLLRMSLHSAEQICQDIHSVKKLLYLRFFLIHQVSFLGLLRKIIVRNMPISNCNSAKRINQFLQNIRI